MQQQPDSGTRYIHQYLKVGEKEKWKNKGMNKQKQPDSGIPYISAHCLRVYQVSIF